MPEFLSIVGGLCDATVRSYINLCTYFEWPEEIGPQHWFMSPELISLYGTPVYEGLDEAERKHLSFYEAANFFSLSMRGERSLIERLSNRLGSPSNDVAYRGVPRSFDGGGIYMTYLGRLCLRYADMARTDSGPEPARRYAPGEDDFLLFASALISSEVIEQYTGAMAKDMRLAPMARQVNLLHHRDHLSRLISCRKVVSGLFKQYGPHWTDETLFGVRHYIAGRIVRTWRDFYNPQVYEDAGLEDPFAIQERVFRSPSPRARRRKMIERCARHFIQCGILDREPPLLELGLPS
jgi:hypothetical protein